MVPYPGIEVLRLPTFFFQNRPRTTKALSPIFCGQGAHCSIAGICFSAESEPEISLCLTEALRCIELGGMKPEGFLFGYLFTAVLEWGWENLMSCCAVYGLLQEWPGKNRHWGLAYTIFFYVSNSFSLFVFVVGLDFKLIREEKHWLLLCFPLLEHLLFSLCQVLVISARDHPVSFSSVLNPFLQISGQYQELSCSISRICSVVLSSRPPGHLQPSSPLICIMYPPFLYMYAGLFFFCFNSKVYYCWSNYAFEKDHRLPSEGENRKLQWTRRKTEGRGKRKEDEIKHKKQ